MSGLTQKKILRNSFLGLVFVALIIEPMAESFQGDPDRGGKSLLLLFWRIWALVIQRLHHGNLLSSERRIHSNAKLGQNILCGHLEGGEETDLR